MTEGVDDGVASVVIPFTSGVKPSAGVPGATPAAPAIVPVLTSLLSALLF